MKKNFEYSSGFSFDDVRVHYNSEKPAQLHAHAYTQGSEVYIAPGQEKHLPHELGHVVQQKSDMVKPTGEIGGLPLNDDEDMEDNADTIAENAENAEELEEPPVQGKFMDGGVVQRNAVSTEGSYNSWAGFGSTFVGMLGIAGGIGSFLYTKHNERKHRYIEEVEKYADAACEASENLLAVSTEGNVGNDQGEVENDQGNVGNNQENVNLQPKAKKLQFRVVRNFEAAIKKANAFGEKIDCTRNMSDGLLRINISSGGIDKIKEKNIKNALERAQNAYISSVGTAPNAAAPPPAPNTAATPPAQNRTPDPDSESIPEI
ncbi:MAG: DUF4157 domain-containing protein [Ruminococcaceae bacterium]|nr:DUF4157 domain-containing protein [Oscillospiraceae bacterium]